MGVAFTFATQIPLQQPTISHDPILSPEFLSFVDELRNNVSIPGISLGVVRLNDDKQPVTQLAAWGRKTEDADEDDLTTDASSLLCPSTREHTHMGLAFVATSLGILMDDYAQGRNATPLPPGLARFDWDTKIHAILPDDWKLDDEWSTRKASVRDVLGHVSGLPRHDYSYHPGDTPKDLIRRMQDLRTAYELREKWSYNNQMYIMGAHIIEQYAGTPFADFISERLFKSLGMSTTTVVPSEALASGKVTHTWTKDGRRIPFWFTDDTAYLGAGAGGVISSAEDMVKWLAVLLNEGVELRTGETVIPRGVYDAVTTARHVALGRSSREYGPGILGYGMGWMQWTYNGASIVSHTGGIPGFSTMTAFSKGHNIGVVILINADEKADHAMKILKRAIDDVLQLPSASDISEPAEPELIEGLPTEADEGAQAIKPPSLDLEDYAGTYFDPGYGAIVLCSPKSTSHHCATVLNDFASLSPLDDATPHLYAAYRTLWSSHIRLRHHSGDRFNITASEIFPQGYGKNTSAFETCPRWRS
ncbi:hypothetical protein NUW54_g4980 [Trametes sanguinea]|uniref:Uncharacterized protein n=2 Tax=Trametes sanguinea TaxID=158606 RepID=A0ACC1PWG0_9APHY|nr:hypothetical protein NUW54_g5796 [Trametes sanguinea]KAJ3004086.1 hypothetical protein NUW54_g4980 [Trametes sanguinea]